MKKTNVNILWLALLVTALFCGCSNKKSLSKNAAEPEPRSQKIKVVTTIFPLYDWTRNIADKSENIDLELLIANGVDLHSFQPSTSDIVKILTADVLVYVGGESDFWIENALRNAVNTEMTKINLMQELSDSVKEEEFVEGMTSDKDDERHALELASHSHDDVEYDEHLWLSVENAKCAVEKISAVLKVKDIAEENLFDANKVRYIEKLDALISECQADFYKTGQLSANNTIIVCDRFPFRYMTDEIGLKYFAAFVGCSAETEASFETVAFLSEKTRELKVNKVFVTESSDKKIARTVIKNAGLSEENCEIAVLDSMQSTTLEQAQSGASYIDTMKENYKKLAE